MGTDSAILLALAVVALWGPPVAAESCHDTATCSSLHSGRAWVRYAHSWRSHRHAIVHMYFRLFHCGVRSPSSTVCSVNSPWTDGHTHCIFANMPAT